MADLVNGIPMINGEQRSWGEVKFKIAGVASVNVIAIEYSETQEVEPVYAAGRNPVGYGMGRITYEGKITLLMEEVLALQASSENQRLQDLPLFDIEVMWLNKQNLICGDILKNCKMKANARGLKSEDTHHEVEIELMIGAIVRK
jgi:hypothetical protein